MTYKSCLIAALIFSGALIGCSKEAPVQVQNEPVEAAPAKETPDASRPHMELSDDDIQSYNLNGDQLFVTLNEEASRTLFSITTTEQFRKLKVTWRGHIMAHASMSAPVGSGQILRRKPPDELMSDLRKYIGEGE